MKERRKEGKKKEGGRLGFMPFQLERNGF